MEILESGAAAAGEFFDNAAKVAGAYVGQARGAAAAWMTWTEGRLKDLVPQELPELLWRSHHHKKQAFDDTVVAESYPLWYLLWPLLTFCVSLILITMASANAWRRRRRKRSSLQNKTDMSTRRSVDLPAESRAAPERTDEWKDVVAARFANECLRRLFSDGGVGRRLMEAWIQGLNEKLSRDGSESSDIFLEVKDITAVSAPSLKDTTAAWRDKELMLKTTFCASTIKLSVSVTSSSDKKSRPRSYVMTVDEVCAQLSAAVSASSTSGEDGAVVNIRVEEFERLPFFQLSSSDKLGRKNGNSDDVFDDVFARLSGAVVACSAELSLSDLGLSHPSSKVLELPTAADSHLPSTTGMAHFTLTGLSLTFGEPPGERVFLSLAADTGARGQTWLQDDGDGTGDEDGTTFCWSQQYRFFARADRQRGRSFRLLLEARSEEDGRSLGRYSVSMLDSGEVCSVQDHVAHLEGGAAKAELRFRLFLHGSSPLPSPTVVDKRLAVLRRMNSSVSTASGKDKQQQHQQQQRGGFDSTSYVCVRSSSDKSKEKYAVSDTALWHLKQDAASFSSAKRLKKISRSTLTIRSVMVRSTTKPLSENGASSKEVENKSKAQKRLSTCSTGRPFIVDCSQDSASIASTCSDCSLEVEAELSGWRGKLADSWEDGISQEGGRENGFSSGESDHKPNSDCANTTPSSSGAGTSKNGNGGGTLGGGNSARYSSSTTLVLESPDGQLHLADGLTKDERKRIRNGKQGIKLHVAMGHAFVAKHVSGGPKCHVCSRSLWRRPGKQAYVCRGCDCVAHKKCHSKIGESCSSGDGAADLDAISTQG